jgi:hypothetical protein
LNVEWKNGTTLIGIWLSGSWLNVNTAGESAVVEVSPVPVVAPVPVCIKADSNKDANCAAVEFEDESIDASVFPDEPRLDNPRLDRSDPRFVVLVLDPEFVDEPRLDNPRLDRSDPRFVVLVLDPELVDDVVVDVVPLLNESDPDPKPPLMTIDRFRVPLFAAEKTGVRLTVVGAGWFVPIEKTAVVPVVKVGVVPAEVMGVTLIPADVVPVAELPLRALTAIAWAPPVLMGVPAGGSPDWASFTR